MSNFNKGARPPRRQQAHEITGASVTVRGDDVSGALRKLKKILEGADRQRELSKREYFEKDSIKRKRAKDQAVKRTEREERKRISSGEAHFHKPTDLKWMKGKRSRRRVTEAMDAAKRAARNRSN